MPNITHKHKSPLQAADDWTRAKLIDIAGSKAKVRGWVYFAEVPRIPYADLKVSTIKVQKKEERRREEEEEKGLFRCISQRYMYIHAIDDLWRSGSGGKFGYSRQREIYARQGQ
eukprot:1330974-Amorphochlora_amoeboformis.AAC.1